MWKEIAEIKSFALNIYAEAGRPDCFDEWHQFEKLADVHIQIDLEPDAHGLYELKIYAYPLVIDHLGRTSTDTSKGIEIF